MDRLGAEKYWKEQERQINSELDWVWTRAAWLAVKSLIIDYPGRDGKLKPERFFVAEYQSDEIKDLNRIDNRILRKPLFDALRIKRRLEAKHG